MATISEFGTAEIKKQEGFIGIGVVTGTEEEVLDQFFSDKVSLVKGCNIAAATGLIFCDGPIMSDRAESLIQVITCREKNKKTGIVEELISHGIDFGTGQTVVMEQICVRAVGYLRIDPELGWVLKED